MMRSIIIVVLLLVSSISQSVGQKKVDSKIIINSAKDELVPLFHPRSGDLYFTRAFSDLNIGGKSDRGDVWRSKRMNNRTFGAVSRLKGELNNIGKNQVIGFNPDGSIMYLANVYDPSLNKKYFAYSVQKNDGEWSAPTPLDLSSFKTDDDYGGSISSDGQVMVIYGQSYGSRGAEDLYVSFRKTDFEWSDPIHLGDHINTAYQEVTPYLAPDHKTLYFSSNGHQGAGSFDVFVAHRLDDSWRNWSTPKNLGSMVNSKGSEKYYRIGPEGILAFYTSTIDSEGYSDIKFIWSLDEEYKQQVEVAQIEANISDSKVAVQPSISTEEESTKELPFLTLKILDAESKLPISVDYKYVFEKEWHSNSLLGVLSFKKDSEEKQIEIRAKGYMPKTVLIANTDSPSLLYLEKLEIEKPIILQEVLFKQSSVELVEKSFGQLEQLLRVLNENPNMIIEIGGHTDNRGSARSKNKLSLNRAEAVKVFLNKKGIQKKRISTKGYGSSHPIASNANEASRKKNRRVEFKVLSN